MKNKYLMVLIPKNIVQFYILLLFMTQVYAIKMIIGLQMKVPWILVIMYIIVMWSSLNIQYLIIRITLSLPTYSVPYF